MNSKFIASALIAAASLACVNAFAAGADNPPEQQRSFVSSQTRAEVRAAALTDQQGAVTSSSQVDGGMKAAAAPAASNGSRNEVRAKSAQTGASSTYNSAPGRA